DRLSPQAASSMLLARAMRPAILPACLMFIGWLPGRRSLMALGSDLGCTHGSCGRTRATTPSSLWHPRVVAGPSYSSGAAQRFFMVPHGVSSEPSLLRVTTRLPCGDLSTILLPSVV